MHLFIIYMFSLEINEINMIKKGKINCIKNKS